MIFYAILFFIGVALLIALSAAANAVADTLENEVAFNASVFYKKDKTFWLKSVSWYYAKKIFTYKIDAWHLFESFQVLILLLIPFLSLLFGVWWSNRYNLASGLMPTGLLVLLYLLLGWIYNLVFNFTYKRLKRKPNGN